MTAVGLGMYEVHPDEAGREGWCLYEVGDGGFYLVAIFSDKDDAEFVREMFQRRDREKP